MLRICGHRPAISFIAIATVLFHLAIAREKQIKNRKREWKIELINLQK
jgi:predicted GIY-YIG superfamily endonuclease